MLVLALGVGGSVLAERVLRWGRHDAADLPPGSEEGMADGKARLVLVEGDGGSVLVLVLVQAGWTQRHSVASQEGLAAEQTLVQAPHSQQSRRVWFDWEGQVQEALAVQAAGLLSGGQALWGLPSCRRRQRK